MLGMESNIVNRFLHVSFFSGKKTCSGTPLIAAALADSAEGIRTLCEARCSLHHRNLLGANAFDTACAHGTIQAVSGPVD